MDDSNDFELIVSDLDADTGVRSVTHGYGRLAGWWSSARVGRWLALAGIVLFTLSLTQTWADFPTSFPTPGPVSVVEVLTFSYPQIGLLPHAIFGIMQFAGFCLWALMWHPQFSRDAARFFALWALATTALFSYIVYLLFNMPVSFPDVGCWLAVAALFLIWNAVLVQFRARSHVAEMTIAPVTSPTHRQFVGASALGGGICIWLIGYFTLFWSVGANCGLSLLQTPHCWPRVNAITALAFVFNLTNYSAIGVAVVLFTLIAGMLCSAIIYCWRNGFQGRRLHLLALALLALTALTILSAAGTAIGIGGADPLRMSLGAGLPVAAIGLSLVWLALIGLYWL